MSLDTLGHWNDRRWVIQASHHSHILQHYLLCLVFSSHHCHDNLLKQVNNEWVKIYPWNWHDGYGQGLVYIPSWQAESTGCHSISSDGASKRVSVETTPNAKQNVGHFLCRTPEGCLFLCTYQPISRRVPAMNSYSVLRQQHFAMIFLALCYFTSAAKDAF